MLHLLIKGNTSQSSQVNFIEITRILHTFSMEDTVHTVKRKIKNNLHFIVNKNR